LWSAMIVYLSSTWELWEAYFMRIACDEDCMRAICQRFLLGLYMQTVELKIDVQHKKDDYGSFPTSLDDHLR
jgi:hypothetical protein